MPLDFLARALRWCVRRVYDLARKDGVIFNVRRDGDRLLQLLVSSVELFASAISSCSLRPSPLYTPPVAPTNKVIRQFRITLQLQLQFFIRRS